MAKPYHLEFYSIATIVVLKFISCCVVSFCDRTAYPMLCNLVIGQELVSRDFGINVPMSQAREALEDYLTKYDQTIFDDQAMEAWIDCLELYKDVINHLNLLNMNPKNAEKWLVNAIFNHQTCLNGFKDLKVHVDVLSGNKPSASKFSTTGLRGFTQLAEGAMIQANVTVAQDGSGDFGTINEAIEATQKQRNGTDRYVIYVKAGIYKENIVIGQSMPNLMLIGDGIDATVITNDKNNHQGLLTDKTATVQVWGLGFIAMGITFENTAGPEYEQAIALLSASDFSVFYRCSFKGFQDTLCLLRYRQFYRECDIYGTVDFIFGDASGFLQNCNIYVRTPLPGQQNTITAQGRVEQTSTTGFVIHNSRISLSPDSTPSNGPVTTYLGRPWRDYSRVVYIKCDFDIMIDPTGWLPYDGNSAAFERVFYAEYLNKGIGANTDGRVTWPGYHPLMSGEEAEQFSVRNFFAGESWIPETGVPFYYGI